MAANATKSLIVTLCVGFLIGLSHYSLALEVTLLDTSTEYSLNWVTHTEPGTADEWQESSYNSQEFGKLIRIYSVCSVEVPGVRNWLRLPYIPRQGANKLHIETKFTVRKCDKHHNPDQLQQCKESFKLLYYEAESDIANQAMPTWDEATYRHIDVIAADRVFTDTWDEVYVNTEVRTVPVTLNGVYLAYYDQGSCVTLMSVRVYYFLCEAMTLNFAVFPNTTTDAAPESIALVEGTCVPHAAIEKSPSQVCRGDGSWVFPQGSCKCMSGYQPADVDQRCDVCPVGTYKWRSGSEPCRPCPAHSEAPSTGSVVCPCVSDYYRSASDDKGMPCTQPPSAPRELRELSVTPHSVNLIWARPAELGGRLDLQYVVECVECGTHVTYHPGRVGFNTTRVLLRGLAPLTTYTVIVYAENGVSGQSTQGRPSQRITVTTKPATPPRVSNVRVSSVGETYISVVWDPAPREQRVIEYELYHYMKSRGSANATALTTLSSNLNVTGLEPGTEYVFKIRAKTLEGWGEYSHSVVATTQREGEGNAKNNPEHAENSVGLIVGLAVAIIVVLAIVVIIIFIIIRRNHRACSEKNVSDCDTLQYSNVQCPHVLDGTLVTNGGLTVPLFNPPGGVKTYIDPHTYEDPNQAVREFTKEIDASCITIESVIGGGEFGDVCKGKFRVHNKGELCVAIKTLKAGTSDKNRLDFLTEASIMGQFDDPNVIFLEGVVTKSNPIMIVTEYMENGSLDCFLRNNDGKFTVTQLVGMMRGIASGMSYLSDMGYVHRDLAARNILVNESLVCKVADFGLSREMECDDTDGAYTTKGGKIPVRWTAPEAISFRKFTSSSDVWSYGVVMWEVMAYSERPYWNWSNQDVIKAVERGFRLPPPMDCPEATYQLMLDCWQKERSHRPKFSSIVKTLDKLIRAPELLRTRAKPKPHQLLDSSVPDLTSHATIDEWLTSIKMERYVAHFLSAGFTHMDQVAHLSLKDLVAMGITLVGHQKKIINSVQTLRAQLYGAQITDGGFLV